MKNSIISLALFSLFTTNALATVIGSKHDLSVLGGEPCAYCHSVHHSVGGMGRPAYMGALPSVTFVYNSATFDHDTVLTLDTINQSDAPLCLTCHDSGSIDTLTDVDVKSALHAKIDGTDRDLTLDLSNDHPVGFVFDATKDPGIKAPDVGSRVHVTFGPGKNEMWCSSCHNVHGGEPSTPFLAMSNAGSALCFECHIK